MQDYALYLFVTSLIFISLETFVFLDFTEWKSHVGYPKAWAYLMLPFD